MRRAIDLVLRHRPLLDRLIVVVGIGSTLAVVLVALVLRRGSWPEQRFLLVYFAPLLIYGAAWARDRLARLDRSATSATLVDAIAFLAGALRSAGGWGVLPYSGHMLFLSYAVATPGARVLRVVAAALFVMTSVFKLLLWNDATSWSLGIAAGLTLAALRAVLAPVAMRMHRREL